MKYCQLTAGFMGAFLCMFGIRSGCTGKKRNMRTVTGWHTRVFKPVLRVNIKKILRFFRFYSRYDSFRIHVPFFCSVFAGRRNTNAWRLYGICSQNMNGMARMSLCILYKNGVCLSHVPFSVPFFKWKKRNRRIKNGTGVSDGKTGRKYCIPVLWCHKALLISV